MNELETRDAAELGLGDFEEPEKDLGVPEEDDAFDDEDFGEGFDSPDDTGEAYGDEAGPDGSEEEADEEDAFDDGESEEEPDWAKEANGSAGMFFDEGADDQGTEVGAELVGDDSEEYTAASSTAPVVSASGEFVVQDKDDAKHDHFELVYVPIDHLAVSHQIRDRHPVDALTSSIRSTGLLMPPVVAKLGAPGYYLLIDGLRRVMSCAKAGVTEVPCLVNNKIKTTEVPIVSAMYNHGTPYTVKEMVAYIKYLEDERGIYSPSMIEYLLQMDNGDYTKLKDILNDNDDDIVSKMMNGQLDIKGAFKALEKRRKSESREDKDNKKAQGVYIDTEESGAAEIEGSGEMGSGDALTEEELKALAINAGELDEADEESLSEMVEEGNSIEGYQPRKQDVKDRKPLDAALRKAVLSRDNCTCRVCGLHVDSMEPFDCHHISPVATGGADSIDNLITLCTTDHRLVHMWAMGTLFLKPEEEMTEEEKTRFRRIIKLGNVIRKQMAAKGIKREEMKKLDHSDTIGRTYPGSNVQYAD